MEIYDLFGEGVTHLAKLPHLERLLLVSLELKTFEKVLEYWCTLRFFLMYLIQ